MNPAPLTAEAVMSRSPVIPVVVIQDWRHAVPLARALAKGGVGIIEITMRTSAALEAVRSAAAEVPESLVGAGTLLNPRDLEAVAEAGARFAVSPGSTRELLDAARAMGMPLLPGVVTASEIMAGLDAGYDRFKLFPATQVGGHDLLKALGGPFPQVKFCPTGGITPETAPKFLALPNVVCVGGSWLAPQAAMEAGDWAAIEALARAATAGAGPA